MHAAAVSKRGGGQLHPRQAFGGPLQHGGHCSSEDAALCQGLASYDLGTLGHYIMAAGMQVRQLLVHLGVIYEESPVLDKGLHTAQQSCGMLQMFAWTCACKV